MPESTGYRPIGHWATSLNSNICVVFAGGMIKTGGPRPNVVLPGYKRIYIPKHEGPPLRQLRCLCAELPRILPGFEAYDAFPPPYNRLDEVPPPPVTAEAPPGYRYSQVFMSWVPGLSPCFSLYPLSEEQRNLRRRLLSIMERDNLPHYFISEQIDLSSFIQDIQLDVNDNQAVNVFFISEITPGSHL